ncbi:hypothetical protein B0G81_1777 [Paraburkholderia sp. BL6665CI2N2]|uniref:hypothetical protein n=1 Tax=Paraburkholderia sp. BL6665CI2N2 TaxID=1938806 RepID=UPI0010E50B0B|nr:hypothetical protein [Paraburkholderia sp. BL6665CI2N2]TDY21554.1 hypothetical protein B0G81_1777 [Paraburkholderia sp. BL6665CI2N2]
MKVISHLDKVRRLAMLRQHLDPLADFELWFWTTLTASTNVFNATLHLAGLTRDDPVFSTIPGVHVAKQPNGSYARELRGLGDVSHVDWPEIEGDVPQAIRQIEQALRVIESHRDPCIRGDRVPVQAIVDECEQAFGEITFLFEQALKGTAYENCESSPQS